MSELVSRFKLILQRINELSPPNRSPVRLIAISKKKPIEDIIELYHAGQRYFGENYVEELEEKSNHKLIHSQCPDIRWHFVGHLQRKKVPRIVKRVLNLDCIQTIDSIDLADRLNLILKQQSKKLNILLQINTSNEKQKSGIEPKEFLSLYEYVKNNCPLLICQGLMTIGSINNVQTENDHDFQVLIKCRDQLLEKYNSELTNTIELSMGMSHDYERAIQAGSTSVRVGSSIFGARR